MQLVDVLGSVRRHWRIAISMLLLSGIALGVFLYTRKQVRGDDRWEASVLLLVPTRGKDGTLPSGVPPELLQGQAQLAFNGATTTAALDRAKLTGAARSAVTFGFRSNYDPASATKNSTSTGRGDILTLTVTAPTQAVAVDLASSYADAYSEARSTKVAADQLAAQVSARRNLGVFQKRLATVDAQLQALDAPLLAQLRLADNAAAAQATSGPDQQIARIVVPAEKPGDTQVAAAEHEALVAKIAEVRQSYAQNSISALAPSSYATIVERPNPTQIVPALPSPWVPVGVALGFGLVLAVGVPVLIDVLDRTIREPRSATKTLGATVLATLPADTRTGRAALASPGSNLDHAYRALATTSIATDQLPRAIFVTAPVGDAQDRVAANFAVALADLGLDVVLVATDARQDWFLESTESLGAPTLNDLLTENLAGRLNGQVRDRLRPSRVENLRVLGPSVVESDDLLEGLPRLLEGLASAGVDVTVIAGPALLEDTSATIYSWSTRSVLWVIEAGEVTEVEARDAASRLELAGASPFGVAMVTEPD